MHSKAQAHSSTFNMKWNPANVALVILTTLLFLVFLFLFISLTAQPAMAQNSVPPTAVQAATMPQFAAKLAHGASRVPGQPRASYRNPNALAQGHRAGPFDSNTLYGDGPINGTTDAWVINFGFVVSDTFTMAANSSITGLTFGAWVFPGGTLQSVEVSITSSVFGGTTYFEGVVNFTQSGCTGGNQYGYSVCTEAGTFTLSNLNQGTYWVNLQNAVTAVGNPVYWDENSGVGCQSSGCPSVASENEFGTIPSEAFTVLGTVNCPPQGCNCPPEGCPPPPPECAYDKPDDGFEIIHNFRTQEPSPAPGLAFDQAGRVYGAIGSGGNDGLGLAYRLAAFGQDWILNPLYSFLGGSSGQNPLPGIVGPDGALYGTADSDTYCTPQQSCGEVFRLTPGPAVCLTAMCAWTETVIYRFQASPDGFGPNGNLVFDRAGNLYGSTSGGGLYGYGTVYELTPSNGQWTEKVIYSFTGQSDSAAPNSLLLGHDGDLYGSSSANVFRLVSSGANWTLQILAPNFACSGLVQDSVGNLYCFATFPCESQDEFGIIFSLAYNNWTPAVLEDSSSYDPFACLCRYHACYDVFHSLAVDSADRLWATQGIANCSYAGCYYGLFYGGNIHQVPFPQIQVTPVSFNGDIFRDLEIAPSRNFYGTTATCGGSYGTVWQLAPP